LYLPESRVDSSLMAHQHIIKLLKEKSGLEQDRLAFYGGFGSSELYALVSTDTLSDIWKFLSYAREVRLENCFPKIAKKYADLSIFTQTRTIPLISYKSISFQDDGIIPVKGIHGDTNATINVQCPAGFDANVNKYFPPQSGYAITYTLGTTDLKISTRKPIKTSDLIENILNFRHIFAKNFNVPICTETNIENPLKLNSLGKRLFDAREDTIQTTIPESLEKNNALLANSINRYLTRLNAIKRDKSTGLFLNNTISYSIYVRQMLEEYEEADTENNIHALYNIEGILWEALNAAEAGLDQRLESSFFSNNNIMLPLPFGDGLISLLLAFETIADFVFSTWGRNHPEYSGDKNWNGFSVISGSYGFKLGYGETFFLPLEATFKPLAPEGSWMVLTHEISHALFIRLNVAEILKEEFEDIRIRYFNGFDLQNTIGADADFEDQVFEIFAHWYDYFHFSKGALKTIY